MKVFHLTARVERLDDVLNFVNDELEAQDVPMKAMMQIDIAVEELYVNIARYAYAPGEGEATIAVDIEPDPRCVVVRFTDRGKPYNPLEKQDPDITLAVEQREIGGLGIYMVKKSMDSVTYVHEDGQNILTIRKLL